MPKPPPPPPPPAAVAYPPPPPPPVADAPPTPPSAAHKMSTQMIAAIAAGAVAIVGGVVALVVVLGGHKDNKAPSANDGPVPVPHSSATTPPSTPPSTAPSTAPSTVPTTEPSTDGGDTTGGDTTGGDTTGGISLGEGVVLVPAPGWQDDGTGNDHTVTLTSPDGHARFFATTGAAQANDVVSVLNADIQNNIEGLSNVQLGDVSSGAGGSAFDQTALVRYSATLSTQQGTVELSGVFVELLNTQSGFSAFVDGFADGEDAYQASVDDMISMVGSLAG